MVGNDDGSRESFYCCVWAVAPGDALYLVGEAPEIGRALGAYRGGGTTTLASRSAIPAVAVVGEESSIQSRLGRELRNQAIVLLFTASIAAVLFAVAWSTAFAAL